MASVRHGHRMLGAVTVLLAGALAGCGGGSSAPSAAPSQPATSSASGAPAPPSVAEDTATANAALVTVADLGAPWVRPKQVNKVKSAAGELCPGQANDVTLAKPRAIARTALTEGARTEATIASFSVHVLEPGQAGAWRAAVAASEQGCLSWKAAEGSYVTLFRQRLPADVQGAEEVLGRVERVYADAAFRSLLYVRQVLVPFAAPRLGRNCATLITAPTILATTWTPTCPRAPRPGTTAAGPSG
jgi:hypothetical protein